MSDRALTEFLSEAQEIIDALNTNLLKMDEQRGGSVEPDLLNECFRGVHSLKGLSGLFGLIQLTELTHTLENLLDSMRLGRIPAAPEILDLLFEAVELFGLIVAGVSEGVEVNPARLAEYLGRLQLASESARAHSHREDALGQYQLPESILSVLTEYEEHRLRENIKSGRTIYRLHASFDLMTIDTGLEALKERIKPLGEVITYLPSADSIDDMKIELDVLVGAQASLAAMRAAIDDPEIVIRAVPRVGAAPEPEVVAVPDDGDTGAPLPPDAPTSRSEMVPAERSAAAAPAAPAAPALPVVAAGEPARPEPEPARAAPQVALAPADAAPTSDEPLAAGSLRSVSQSVRVDIRKLDALMNVVGELSLVHAGISEVLERLGARIDILDEVRRLGRDARALERRIGELQSGILEVRMVPLRQVFDKLSRVVRKISRESAKEIRLDVTGADTELDKLIVEELSDPLMHIIRNAIDHGIELPEDRVAAGKPAVGTVRVAAKQQGNRVVVTVSDDGAGIDVDRVADAAVRRGLIERHAVGELSRRELLGLLFLPGMSTREEATELSGRGVGLDVVKTNIARLSGIIDVTSTPGAGTEFEITLPITLAIIQALIIESAGRTYAVPLNSVLESLIVERGDVRTVEGREVVSLRHQTLPLAWLDRLFELRRPEGAPAAPDKLYVVVIGLAQHRLGLVVDELLGERDIVIKSLGRALQNVPGIAGATELGHQRAVLVLDVPALVEEARRGGATHAGEAA